MPEYPEMNEFPKSGQVENMTLPGRSFPAYGAFVAQNADDLFEVTIDLFTGPTPQHGTVRMTFKPEEARDFAQHMLRLSQFAEIGVEAHD